MRVPAKGARHHQGDTGKRRHQDGRRRGAGDQRACWRDSRAEALPEAYALRAFRARRSLRNIPPRQGFSQRSPHIKTQPPWGSRDPAFRVLPKLHARAGLSF
jgi:hypothetical protein